MESRTPATPSPEIAALLGEALGTAPIHWSTPHTGLSRAKRYIVNLANGSSVFVKAATDDSTERQLRAEHEILSSISADFLPREVAWITTGIRPLLVLEGLGAAHWPADHWPVEWKPGQFDLLFDVLDRVASAQPPATLPGAEIGFEPSWPVIAANPERFLALGVCSKGWFERAIDALIQAEAMVPLSGTALVHNDVRSDNLCFVGDRVVLVDWGSALRGNPEHDLTTALTTLPLEGGPDPFTVLPRAGAWAAYHGGRHARRMTGSAEPLRDPVWLRKVLQRLTAISLAWAAHSLGLLPFDGRDWHDIS